MSGRTIAIGDVHGCALALKAVLDAVSPGPDDVVVTLGDYIDRGPNSRGVIEQLMDLASRCTHIPLIGNHEVMLLIALENEQDLTFWRECGGNETLASYGGKLDDIPQEHLEFVRKCGLGYETESHIFVHANYDPWLPLNEQEQHVLLWKHLETMPQPHESGKTVVMGHTPQRSGEILDIGHLMCIDTFCFGSGCLSAVDLDSKYVWQADRHGNRLDSPNADSAKRESVE